MPVTAKLYTKGLVAIVTGGVVWAADTIKVMLTTSAYVPDRTTHQFKTSVTNELPTAGGYTAGGFTLASKAPLEDGVNRKAGLDAADISVGTATFTTRYAVVYKDTGTAATSAILGYVDFGADMSPSNGPFSITWAATGVFDFTADL